MDSLDPVSAENLLNSSRPKSITTFTNRPSKEEAMAAVRTLLAWAGDNPPVATNL